ncbi:uncharacterized protein LOC117118156 [Anneissia japonica]|uniref:uncharacterized protein LOC117118156 n=1 Tax=Anneissia japonica TaxID=1529436 RepID=UPI001425735D|nr:uncharacterized protein LOC117118156 [Anneissia japonica]
MDYNNKNRLKGHFPSINDTGKLFWPMSYHKNRVRRSSAFASGRYSSLVPAVLEKQEQKTLDAREEKERRRRKKQRAAERSQVDKLLKEIQIMQEEEVVMPIQKHTPYEVGSC